jgi:hypothetical protein
VYGTPLSFTPSASTLTSSRTWRSSATGDIVVFYVFGQQARSQPDFPSEFFIHILIVFKLIISVKEEKQKKQAQAWV